MDSFAIFKGRVRFAQGGEVPLPADALGACANRISKTIGFSGTTMCMPLSSASSNDVDDGSVALIVNGAADENEFSQLVKHIAAELGCEVFTGDVNHLAPFCIGDDDCDLSFLDRFPTQDEEIGAIWLKFTIEHIDMMNLRNKLSRLCAKRKYDCEFEDDGAVVYVSTTIALDLFYDELDQDFLDGELDATYAGAGIYAEVCEFVRELATSLGGEISFHDTDRVSYPLDGDFNKLRAYFHEAMRQQLAFAAADDRDGMQAYIGWSIDTFEPEEIPGTVVTHLGRYDLDRLFDEITAYGFEAVADKRFLVRNTRYRTSDESVKSALALLWAQCSHERFMLRDPNELFVPEHFAMRLLDEAMVYDPCPCIPIDEYVWLCELYDRDPDLPKKCTAYSPHYEIGYLKSDISYGFGSYLRRFKLPGSYIAYELEQGRHVRIGNCSNMPFDLPISLVPLSLLPPLNTSGADSPISFDITIIYEDHEPTPVDEYLTELHGEITVFDIGGNSQCRAVIGDDNRFGYYTAKAEIIIRDERYLIECKACDRERIEGFFDIIAGSRAIEEVDDLPTTHPGEKPRAWGACYFLRNQEQLDLLLLSNKLSRQLQDTLRIINRISFIKGPATDTNSKLGGTAYMPEGAQLPTVAENPETLANGTAAKPLELVLQLNFDDFEKLIGFPEKGILQLWCYSPSSVRYIDHLFCDQTYFRVLWYPEPGESLTVCDENADLILARQSFMNMSPEDKRFDELPDITKNLAARIMRADDALFDRLFCKDGSWIGGYRTTGRTDECYESGGELICQLMTENLRIALMIEREDLDARRFERARLYIDNRPSTEPGKGSNSESENDCNSDKTE